MNGTARFIGKFIPIAFSTLITLMLAWPSTGMAYGGTEKGRNPRIMSPLELEIRECEDKIVFAKSEIKKTRDNLKWLSLNIKQMEDFGHFVPKSMYDSIKFKKSKIKALKKLQMRFEDLLKRKTASGKRTSFKKTKVKGKKADKISGNGLEQDLQMKLKKSGLGDWIELTKSGGPLRLENRLPILFASGSASVAKEYKTFLKNLATLVKKYDIRVIVEGFADTDPIKTKKYRSNFELGATRAANVAYVLIKNGVKPKAVKIGSTGEYRLASHKASEWKSLERHVNLTILFKK